MQMCKFCIMDSTDPDIVFDSSGICNHCKNAKNRLNLIEVEKASSNILEKVVEDAKDKGTGLEYDCIVGISGGVDSCYTVYHVVQLGLRPLVVHIDNGWDAELAVENIHKLLERLKVDLYTYVVDWQEFRDIQLAFLKASTPDSEIPTDHMIRPVLSMVAHKYHIRYIFDGCNITSESVLPKKWSYGHEDWKYIKAVHKRYGKRCIKTFPHFNRWDNYYFTRNRNCRLYNISLLNYIEYDKEKAKEFLIREFGWKDYGGKHFESFYTKFYQTYILPVKFGYDKRKMHFSSLIVSGQMTREDALHMMEEPLYNPNTIERDINYFCEKMQITRQEFDEIMENPCKSYLEYPNYENDLIGKLQSFVRQY